jgi:hypothetical protein
MCGNVVRNAAATIATTVWKLLRRPEDRGIIWDKHVQDRAFFGRRPQFENWFDRAQFDQDDNTYRWPCDDGRMQTQTPHNSTDSEDYRRYLGNLSRRAMLAKAQAGLPTGRIPLGYRHENGTAAASHSVEVAVVPGNSPCIAYLPDLVKSEARPYDHPVGISNVLHKDRSVTKSGRLCWRLMSIRCRTRSLTGRSFLHKYGKC